MTQDAETMQALADAQLYIEKGYKLTDGRIERFYRSNPAATYSLNEFFEAVHQAAETQKEKTT